MRVVETETTPTYKMGKNRKHRLRKKNEGGGEESSEEGATGGVSCTHINKAVNQAAVRKALSKPSVTFGECVFCLRDKEKTSKEPVVEGATAAVTDTDSETTIWVCLQCGHQGCDRNSKDRHALAHYETPHSGIHCVVVNLTTWSAWCYACDDEIPLETTKRVQECVDMLRKMAGLPRTDHSSTASAARRGRVEPSVDQAAVKDKPRPTTPRSGATGSACQKVKGLSNLGNTCFFNAVMQNLSQTHSLETLLCERTKKGRALTLPGRSPHSDSDSGASSDDDSDEDTLKDFPQIDIVPPDAGPLTQHLMTFLQEMNNTASRNMTVNPSGLFGLVCKKAPRFKGFQQQDSHELLRYLLDVIRTEEIKRGQTGILRFFKVPESTNPKKVDGDTKSKVKEYGRQVKHTFLDSLFGGQLVSTVMCEECKQVSQIFEPFLDLSLPVTEEKPLRPNLILGGRKKESTETQEEVKGSEGIAERSGPSKHSEKKNKKQAKKEAKAKRRGAKLAKQKSWVSADDVGGKEDGGATGEDGKMSHSVGDKLREDEGEESGSCREDQSDADVEDNLESDTSRLMNTSAAEGSTVELEGAPARLSVSAGPRLGGEGCRLHTGECDSANGVCAGSGDIRSHCSGMCVNNVSSPAVNVNKLCDDLSGLTFADQSESEEEDATNICSRSQGQCVEVKPCSMDSQSSIHKLPVSSNLGMVNGSTVMNGIVEGSQACSTSLLDSSDKPAVEGAQSEPPDESDSQLTLKEESEDTTIGHSPRDLTDCPSLQSADGIITNGLHPCERHSPNQAKNKVELKKQAQYKSVNSLAPRYQPAAKECSIMSCMHQFTSAELLTGSNKFGCKQCTRNKRNKSIPQQKDKKSSETVYSNASKQYHIFIPPAILTLHLKRFEQVGFTSRKVNRHVDFPFLFDLAPYCSALCQGIRPGQKKILYSLYGVVEHSGRLSGGHYTAYVKVRPSLSTMTNYLHPQCPTPRDYVHHYANRMLNGPRSPGEEDLSDETLEGLVPPGKWYHISDSRVSEVQEANVQRAQAYLLFYERIY